MHFLKKARIAYLKANEALTEVSDKYIDFVNIFLPKLAAKFPEYIGIDNYAIKSVND